MEENTYNILWKYITTWESKNFADKSLYLQSLYWLLCLPRFHTIFATNSPLSLLTSTTSSRPKILTLPHCIITNLLHKLCPQCPVPQFPVLHLIFFWSVYPILLLTLVPREKTHSLSYLPLNCIFIFLPSCMYGSCFQIRQLLLLVARY